MTFAHTDPILLSCVNRQDEPDVPVLTPAWVLVMNLPQGCGRGPPQPLPHGTIGVTVFACVCGMRKLPSCTFLLTQGVHLCVM